MYHTNIQTYPDVPDSSNISINHHPLSPSPKKQTCLSNHTHPLSSCCSTIPQLQPNWLSRDNRYGSFPPSQRPRSRLAHTTTPTLSPPAAAQYPSYSQTGCRQPSSKTEFEAQTPHGLPGTLVSRLCPVTGWLLSQKEFTRVSLDLAIFNGIVASQNVVVTTFGRCAMTAPEYPGPPPPYCLTPT
ncbi:hypothetical protein PCASD_24701 [Puccinia coronata f. sp. avenae]|uniref:Uncharacterized protein n=1 Tax=Puccinia coronata f. sp. avenae TaxID=200324 RepID=A0A2N5TIK3_9BASI|nr:hypothetical protein PCASD_24701 [Puccinia coronata f. sp. avenae]